MHRRVYSIVRQRKHQTSKFAPRLQYPRHSARTHDIFINYRYTRELVANDRHQIYYHTICKIYFYGFYDLIYRTLIVSLKI